MTDTATVTLTVDIPAETHRMLLAYAKTRNSPLGNAVSAAIVDGIEATCVLHPDFRERAGLEPPHPMSTAARIAARKDAP